MDYNGRWPWRWLIDKQYGSAWAQPFERCASHPASELRDNHSFQRGDIRELNLIFLNLRARGLNILGVEAEHFCVAKVMIPVSSGVCARFYFGGKQFGEVKLYLQFHHSCV